MKKVFIAICFLLLFSGCTIDYNITFRYDNRINENVKFTIPNKTIEDSGYTVKESTESALQSYKDILKTNKFSSSAKYNSDNVVVTLKSKNKSVSEFTSFLYFRMMFNGADIEDTDDYYSFKTNGVYNQSGLFYDLSGIADEGFVDQININIKFENKVISSNADKVDNDTYTWILTKDTEEKVIEFKVEKDKTKYEEPKKEKKKKKSSINFIYLFIFLGGLAGAVVVVIIYAMGLNAKRNKI